MRLVLFGPPGSGKGTQATDLCAHIGIPAISTGSIFRAMGEQGGPLAETVLSYIDRGEFVPDEVTNQVVRERLAEDDARNGFLLDGYPRNRDQVLFLDAMLAEQGLGLDVAIKLVVPTEVIIERLANRAQTEHRADDDTQVIRHRIDVYEHETLPLGEMYSERGILHEIDGTGSIDEVGSRLRALAETLTKVSH